LNISQRVSVGSVGCLAMPHQYRPQGKQVQRPPRQSLFGPLRLPGLSACRNLGAFGRRNRIWLAAACCLRLGSDGLLLARHIVSLSLSKGRAIGMERRVPRRRPMTQLSHVVPIVYSVTTSGATIDSQTLNNLRTQRSGKAPAFCRTRGGALSGGRGRVRGVETPTCTHTQNAVAVVTFPGRCCWTMAGAARRSPAADRYSVESVHYAGGRRRADNGWLRWSVPGRPAGRHPSIALRPSSVMR
jgi:hypothetical protein